MRRAGRFAVTAAVSTSSASCSSLSKAVFIFVFRWGSERRSSGVLRYTGRHLIVNAPGSSTTSTIRKASLFYFVFVMFSYTTGGPFGLEAMITTSGPGMSLIYLLILPLFLGLPVSLVGTELTPAMPVEGGFYRWTRAAFGDFWGFLAGWWNWSASFLLGGVYAVLFADYL